MHPPSQPGYNPFDPIQDTESRTNYSSLFRRVRYNPFDPIQDTESLLCFCEALRPPGLQPIRSDTGY